MATPSGANVTIQCGEYRATVVEVGAGLRNLTRAGVDLVAPYAVEDMCTGGRGQVLLPWPNRIADGRYRFAGEDCQLPLSEAAKRNAIHGLTRWVAWTLLDSSPSRARWGCRLFPQPGYRHHLELVVTYSVSDRGLRVDTSATNVGPGPAPFGSGAHPYLTVGRPLDGCELRLPSATRCPSDDRGLPGEPEPVEATEFDFRTRRPIGATVFDNAFGSLQYDEGRATAELHDPESGRTVSLWLDDSYRWLQVFSGEGQGDLERSALAVEPMTCPANAFRSAVDLVVLEPGQVHRAAFGIG